MSLRLLSLYTLLFISRINEAQTSLISAGSNWKYLDNGTDPGTAWRSGTFNDASWASGNAELGYGDGDEATVVSYGSSSSNKYISTYFRKTFTVTNPSQFTSLDLQAVRDDGIIVYINGTEVWRNNMPSGNVNSGTLASSTIAFGSESSWNQTSVSSSFLTAGSNVIAVEIHQDAGNSSDISFNLKLNGNTTATAATVDRGPYLNIGTSSGMIVKWRTTQATDSKVYYGTTAGNLNMVVSNPAFVTDHELKITGLNSSTVYYYAVGCTGSTLTPQSNTTYFKTSPVQGTKGHYKFWAIGDAGTGDTNQQSATAGFLNYTANGHIDGWIWLGDNAYDNGYDSQYQSSVFTNNTYENELKRMVLWPAPGNHDYNNHIPFSPSPAYYDIFTLPTAAEAGGLASGTEKYYSYNYGNIHFIVLDSYDEGRNATDPMAIWLTNDLAANTMPWTIAYWHHPPYTKGSHNSDNSNLLDGELPEIRQNIIPIIEAGGVDLVLNGHSHSYERTYLLDGHYGNSNTLQPSMIKDNGTGSYPTACPYQKQTTISKSHKGTVYTVCGCSGKLSSVSSGWPHPAMSQYSSSTLGTMLIEINDNKLDAKFINSTGTASDAFTIVKNAGKKTTLTGCPGDSKTLKPSWPGNVQWFPTGTTQDSIVVNPMVSTTYYAYDALSCIKDTFVINMLPAANCSSATAVIENELNSQIIVYPNVVNTSDMTIHVKFIPELVIEKIHVYDVNGKKYPVAGIEMDSQSLLHFSPERLGPGMYFVELILSDERKLLKKIIVTN
ncbi:MAG: metallophosphoesterase [Bacteroidota bacterium]